MQLPYSAKKLDTKWGHAICNILFDPIHVHTSKCSSPPLPGVWRPGEDCRRHAGPFPSAVRVHAGPALLPFSPSTLALDSALATVEGAMC